MAVINRVRGSERRVPSGFQVVDGAEVIPVLRCGEEALAAIGKGAYSPPPDRDDLRTFLALSAPGADWEDEA